MELLLVVGVIVLLAVIVGIYLWSTYNGLVRLNVRVDEAWSDITVQLKRRADLIPNLIEAVKGYAAHEKQVFGRQRKIHSGWLRRRRREAQRGRFGRRLHQALVP